MRLAHLALTPSLALPVSQNPSNSPDPAHQGS